MRIIEPEVCDYQVELIVYRSALLPAPTFEPQTLHKRHLIKPIIHIKRVIQRRSQIAAQHQIRLHVREIQARDLHCDRLLHPVPILAHTVLIINFGNGGKRADSAWDWRRCSGVASHSAATPPSCCRYTSTQCS